MDHPRRGCHFDRGRLRPELFASDALSALYGAALGALRKIDRLATEALREAARRRRKLVDHETTERVLARAEREGTE